MTAFYENDEEVPGPVLRDPTVENTDNEDDWVPETRQPMSEMSEPTGMRGGAAGPVGTRPPQGRFRTLGDFNGGDDDDDEEGRQNFFAGGEKSYSLFIYNN